MNFHNPLGNISGLTHFASLRYKHIHIYFIFLTYLSNSNSMFGTCCVPMACSESLPCLKSKKKNLAIHPFLRLSVSSDYITTQITCNFSAKCKRRSNSSIRYPTIYEENECFFKYTISTKQDEVITSSAKKKIQRQ